MKKTILFLFSAFALYADTLDIAIYNFPPCVILEKGEDPRGFDIDVLKAVTREAGLNVQYKIQNKFVDLLAGVEQNKFDGAISGITITGNREKNCDFTHPYLNSGLSILINKDAKINPFKTIFRYIANIGSMLILLTIFTAFFGILLFFVENRCAKKDSLFNSDKTAIGMFNGYYFGNVASTTMGFGDFVPKSIPGKLITIVMAYIGIYFILPYATANMNMALQQEHEIYSINSPEDLPGKIVATEKGTTSESYLKKLGCNVKDVHRIYEAYDQLESKKVDAVVFDMPTIKYIVQHSGKNKFKTTGSMFDKQVYGIALVKNSPYREILNEKIADFMRTEDYWDLHKKWFGD